MDERDEIGLREEFDQLHQCREIGAVDEIVVGLEGIGAIGDAIEQRSGAELADHVARRRQIGEIDFENMPALDAVEPPGRQHAHHAIDVVAMFQQHAQQIGADEAARPEHEDRPAQGFHPIANFQHRPVASAEAASRMLVRSKAAASPKERLRSIGAARISLGA